MGRRGVFLGPVIGGLALFALSGLLWWAQPRWCSAYALLLGLPAVWLIFIAPVKSRDWFMLRMRERVIAKAPPGEGALVLDAGTGRGIIAAGFARAAPGVRVVGLDAFRSGFVFGKSPAHAISSAEREGVADRVGLVRGSVRDIPFGDAAFDLVICSPVFHDVCSRRAFEEMARVLRPGGRFVCVDFVARSDRMGGLGLVCRESFDVPLGARAWIFDKERELATKAPGQM